MHDRPCGCCGRNARGPGETASPSIGRKGQKIACPEEVALHMGFVDPQTMRGRFADDHSEYGQYVLRVAAELLSG